MFSIALTMRTKATGRKAKKRATIRVGNEEEDSMGMTNQGPSPPEASDVEGKEEESDEEESEDLKMEEEMEKELKKQNEKPKKASSKKIDLSKLAKPEIDPEEKQHKSGVLYFPSIPPFFTASRMREELSRLGAVGRMYLQPEKRRTKKGVRRKRYTEGWVEFASKSLAKRIALSINNTPVGARRRSAAADSLWSCKYLSGFKWIHLVEQLAYEKRLESARMRAEISQAKRVAEHFEEQIDKGKHLKKLEEKVLKKGGVWTAYQRQLQQRKIVSAKKSAKKEKAAEQAGSADNALMKMIFADD